MAYQYMYYFNDKITEDEFEKKCLEIACDMENNYLYLKTLFAIFNQIISIIKAYHESSQNIYFLILHLYYLEKNANLHVNLKRNHILNKNILKIINVFDIKILSFDKYKFNDDSN